MMPQFSVFVLRRLFWLSVWEYLALKLAAESAATLATLIGPLYFGSPDKPYGARRSVTDVDRATIQRCRSRPTEQDKSKQGLPARQDESCCLHIGLDQGATPFLNSLGNLRSHSQASGDTVLY
jgi:hypothetical protein